MRGAIKWMVGNHVATNMLMILLVAGGLIIGKNIKQEVFPEIEADRIMVSVAYPGAGPLEVEDGIVRAIEQSVSSLDNVKRIRSTAIEGMGQVTIELLENSNVDAALNDVKSEVDRILTFPEEAEEPVITSVLARMEVISLIVYGNASELALTQHAEMIRDGLLAKPNITQVELSAVRNYEISVEISEETLRSYNLTLQQVAGIIRRSSLDLPGGSVKTEGGEVLIRTREKRYTGDEFAQIAVLTRPDGGQVFLSDIATIKDAFEDADYQTAFDGQPAAMLNVYRVGNQSPKDVAATVREYIAEYNAGLPPTMHVDVGMDWSVILQQRLDLLQRNGTMGLILVMIILGLFLELRLAFWVAIAIPVSFLGAIFLMPAFDVSINMLSLFAFILALGLVVDDAILVGENVYSHREQGKSFFKAAVDGTIEISGPVIFSVLTTVAAFLPLLFVSGAMGKFMSVIPTIVISVLMISLVESLFVLPSHLSGKISSSKADFWKRIESHRHHVDEWLQRYIQNVYKPVVIKAIRNRYTTAAIATAFILLTIGLFGGGFIKFVFFPQIDSDEVNVQLTMPPGTPYEETKAIIDQIRKIGEELVVKYDAEREDSISNIKHVFSAAGVMFVESGHGSSQNFSGNLGQVLMLFQEPDVRNISTVKFAIEWRDAVGEIPGVERLVFSSDLMAGQPDLGIALSHDDFDILLTAVDKLKETLGTFDGVSEIADSHTEGKRELQLKLKPAARSLGITESDLAAQVRSAFYGAEALRLQRGRNEVKVMVRYPKDERESLEDIDQMMLRTPMGGEVPFHEAAYVEDGRGYSEIKRTDRRRIVEVTASVDNKISNADEIMTVLNEGILAQMQRDYPGLIVDLEGERRNQAESMGSLYTGFMFALILIYGLLAIPLRSFTQPFIVMSVIPFGLVGAVLGHIILGYDLSMLSMFGFVALAGVVVNGSLVLIDFVNRARANGMTSEEAVVEAGVRRFRPIILTSLTTFFGLFPLLLETSIQARFMIPMAISLGCGVLFTAFVILLVTPTMYLILEDLHLRVGYDSSAPLEQLETATSREAA
ncbi:efflux RND transporter permease subunit [bacterium]|nr:efflux RND transporter permease subunit [bacterium]